MGKVDVYIGGYLTIDDVTAEESERLASNACVIGMPVVIRYDAETSQFTVALPSGESLGVIHPKNRLAIREALEGGWTCASWLSLVYYTNEEKLFKGEIVYQMFRVKPTQTKEQANLEAYTLKTSERLANGERPSVVLTGNSWDQVIENGDYVTEKEQALPIDTKRNSGVVVVKRKRSAADKLASAAIERKPGCRIALIVAVIVVCLLVLLFLWQCVF